MSGQAGGMMPMAVSRRVARWPAWGWNFGLSKKFAVAFCLLLLVTLANVLAVQAMLTELQGIAETVNVAGRLRMLSQRLAFELTVVRHEGRDAGGLGERLTLFEAALRALEQGDSAFGYRLRPASDQTTPLLKAIAADWRDYRGHIERLLGERPGDRAGFSAELARTAEHSGKLLADAEVFVDAITVEAKHLQQRIVRGSYLLVGLDAVVLAAIFLAVRRRIVMPLRDLARGSAELARGNHAVQVAFRSRDEIGLLAEVFNQAARQISGLVASLNHDREELREAETLFRGLAENSVVGVYIVQDGRFRFVNPTMAEMFAYRPAEMLSSVGIFDIFPPQERSKVEDNLRRRLSGEVSRVNYETLGRKQDGSVFCVEVFGSTMSWRGEPATIGVMLDITEKKRIERALRTLSAGSRVIAQAADDAALVGGVCRLLVELSGYRHAWIGYAAADGAVAVRGQASSGAGGCPSRLQRIAAAESESGSGPTAMALCTGLPVILKGGQLAQLPAAWQAAAAELQVAACLAVPLRGGNRTFAALTIYAEDGDAFSMPESELLQELAGNAAYGLMSLQAEEERRRHQRQLEYHANHDALTGLANRNLLSDRLRQAMAWGERSGRQVAVLLHDLDQFKVINDSIGHEAGDTLLRAVAGRLLGVVRQGDTVARLGGDEFVVVMPDVARPQDAAVVARKILDALALPFDIAGQEVYVSASIGISLCPPDSDPGSLLRNADLAMYRAKHEGRNNFQFFSEEMNTCNRERMALEIDLRRALERGELSLVYQPRVCLRSGEIVAAEALLRWQHPWHGAISPEKFIPIAEEAGLINHIGEWVMATACGQNRAWQEAGLPAIRISVNVSARQFRNNDMASVVRRVLEQSRLEAAYLELEVTESTIMQCREENVRMLAELKEIGVLLSMDDFGTGYSSLNHLRSFPFDNLKLDKSFIHNAARNFQDAAIVRAVVDLGSSLKLRTVAEGVETAEQLRFLESLGCDEMQGYFFSRPLPPEAFRSLLLRREHPLPLPGGRTWVRA